VQRPSEGEAWHGVQKPPQEGEHALCPLLPGALVVVVTPMVIVIIAAAMTVAQEVAWPDQGDAMIV
jgi:hypothetical protein